MNNTKQTKDSIEAISRHMFAKALAAGLILMVALVVLPFKLQSDQQGGDALFIDGNGNVGIGTNQPTEKLDVDGTVKAKMFEGEGSALMVEGEENLKEMLNKKLNKSGDVITGDLTINSTGAVTLPSGTTAERPASPENGAFRYNSETKMFELFFEGMWFKIETTPYMRSTVKVFEYKGADQTFTVPESVTKILVKAWGAGGAGGTEGRWKHGSYGGGGGFSRGILTVTPGEKLKIIIGEGGKVYQDKLGYGGGGPATRDKDDNKFCGGGGGRSAVVRQAENVQLLVAGGGGGGGSTRSSLCSGKGNSGGAGGGIIGENGYSLYDGKHRFGGRGGGQDFEGGGGEGNGGPGNGSNGGHIEYKSYGGGGGGGWKGGGSGGFSQKNTMGGGGGGSGYIGKASYAITITGSQRQCPMQDDPDYLPGVGIGGKDSESGGNGLIVISW